MKRGDNLFRDLRANYVMTCPVHTMEVVINGGNYRMYLLNFSPRSAKPVVEVRKVSRNAKLI